MIPALLAAAAATAAAPKAGLGTLLALLVFIAASVWIGLLANRAMQSASFMKGFFLGNRGLGSWALALTATVQSGGTFMGFPSLVYSHGWAVLIWISGYMVVPITGFAMLGKRFAQLSRLTGAITVPDLFRERFGSPTLGLVASLFILFYMSAMMVAQFKAGALVMKLSWPGSGVLALAEDDDARFRLTESSLKSLQSQQFEPAQIRQLQPLLNVGFKTEREFTAAVESVAQPGTRQLEALKSAAKATDWMYLAGLIIFTVTVVGYTLMGGFLAAVWTDLFQSVMMWLGVIFLTVLALKAAGGLEAATLEAVSRTSADFAFGPGYDPTHSGRQFLPLGLAASFFTVWVFAGVGSPAGMVRIMACKDTGTIRRSIYLLAAYNAFIYIPLVVICICGRALIPDLTQTDEIIPRLAIQLTSELPAGSFLAGLILAAPFGAVMATVSSYLVVIASGLVRDVYQRFINPQASPHELKRLSYFVMVAVGLIAVLANINPVQYLQAIVVFSGTGAAATFCVPAFMLAYWRRATVSGMLAAMLTGAAVMVCLYGIGFALNSGYLPQLEPQTIGQNTSFRPYYLFDVDPLIWAMAASLLSGIAVSLLTPPLNRQFTARFFEYQPTAETAA